MLSKTARSSAGLFRAASLKLPALSTPVAASCASSLGAALRRSLQTSSVPATPANVPANVAAFISAKHDAHAMQDRADARSLVRLACTLNRDAEDPWFYNPVHGTHPASHWLYCNEGDNTSELNADGYSNIHRPPAPYSVLLWGGGTIHFHDAMMLNDDVQALTRIARPEHKVGKTGDMVLVTRTTDYVSRSKKHLVRDVTNLVYRNANAPKPAERELSPAELEARARPLEKGKDFDWERSTPFETDPRALFRFSALTWNAHRIHYDTAFAQSDGHPGPLVHGPMQATVLLDFAGEVRTPKTKDLFGHTDACCLWTHSQLMFFSF
jgi:3-methylfumaryl-CoA hydratase